MTQQTEKPSRILYFQKHRDRDGDVCVIFASHLGHEDERTAAGIYGALDVLSQGKFGLTPLWESVRVEMPGPFPHVPFNVGPWSAAIIAGPTWDASEAAKAKSHD